MNAEWWNEVVFYDNDYLTRRELYTYLLRDGYSRQYARYHAGDALKMLPHEIEALKKRQQEQGISVIREIHLAGKKE